MDDSKGYPVGTVIWEDEFNIENSEIKKLEKEVYRLIKKKLVVYEKE